MSIPQHYPSITSSITYSVRTPSIKVKLNGEKSAQQFRQNISLEIYHVESGHGINQARLAVKTEMEKYIEYLINNGLYSNQYIKHLL